MNTHFLIKSRLRSLTYTVVASTWLVRLRAVLSVCLLTTGYADAQYEQYPPGFSQVMVTSGLNAPTSMAFAPDGRIFVTEQGGKVRVIKNSSLLVAPFVQLNVFYSGESGLNGIVLDPNFATNGYIYLYYTVFDPLLIQYHNRVSRFTAAGDEAVMGSETTILDLDPLSYVEQHNGGAMNFGPDGKLYIVVGDSHNSVNAQNPDTYLGKLLRINPDGSVPTGNPFTTGSEQRKRTWAYGLRNPFTFDIQPVTGRIFVNDVGEETWEEINEATIGGRNFGWPSTEGVSSNPAYTNPIFAYPHSTNFEDWGCAITGGVFFNPTTTTYPASFIGKYFYQDYCTSSISILDLSGSTATRSWFGRNLPGQPVGTKIGSDGNLYFLSRGNNALYKIIYSTNIAPNIVSHPTNVTVAQGQSAGFTVTATGTAPLAYQWQKNGTNIIGATSSTYSIISTAATDAGQYQVIVSNAAGSVTSNPATLSVTAPNQLPTVTILSPTNHTLYRAGDVISFSGSATDPEDGVLPASAFAWTVEFHHNVHYHPGPSITPGIRSGQFTIPTQGETATDVFYRLILTVTDSRGGVSTASVDIDPRIVTVNLATNLTGLTLNLDGQPFTTPYTRQFVSGIVVGLSAPTSQVLNNTAYIFNNWTTGPGASGTITIPDVNTTYMANYSLPPDLTPIIYARPSSIYGNSPFNVVVDVLELNSVATGGVIVVKLTRDPMLKLSFDPAATSVNGQAVQNSAWSFDGSGSAFYVLTTKQAMSAGGRMSFGLSGTLNPGATLGVLTISSAIVSSEGELKIINNISSNKIEYFNQ